jgi:hypothetical protein
MRGVALLLALQTGVGVVGGLAFPAQPPPGDLHTPSSFQTTTTTSGTAAAAVTDPAQATFPSTSTTSTSSSSSYSPTPTLLFLPVSGASPDPLGISKVSGFYGPGAWTAWFLTIVASWIGGIREPGKRIDVNTALFLLGTNWAAVDVFRSIHALRSVRPDQPDYEVEFTKGMGNYAAAFTIAFWGIIHALLQMVTLSSAMRARMLVVGMVLPLVALTATAFGPILARLDGHAINSFPALYWKGMREDTHSTVIKLYVTATPILLIAPAVGYLYKEYDSIFPRRLKTIFTIIKEVAVSDAADLALTLYILLSLVTLLVSVLLSLVKNDEAYLWGMAPFLLLFSPIILVSGPIACLVLIPGNTIVYIFEGYLGLGSNASESCFFMPCAPQTIKEEDQLYALLAGLFALGYELALPLYKKLRQGYRERRLFVQDVEGRLRQFEMRRTTAAARGS